MPPGEVGLASLAGLPFGRTAVRPYKKCMILNRIRDQKNRHRLFSPEGDWLSDRLLPKAASLPDEVGLAFS